MNVGRGAVKAWAGAAVAALAAVSVALVDHQSVTWADAGTILGAAVAGWQGVYWSPKNREIPKGR